MRPQESDDARQASQAEQEVAEIQQLLLPAALPQHEGWGIASHYQPCDASGGDFYGFREGEPGRLLLLVADVSGHGARAAVVMAMLRAWLEAHHAFGREAKQLPVDINSLFGRMSGLGVFVTGVFADINVVDGAMRYINCGHPFPRVLRASGSVEVLRGGHAPPLGVLDELGVEDVGETRLHAGDSLVLYTDGITEAPDPDARRFDDQGLDQSLRAGGAPHDVMRGVLEALAAFRRGAAREDDECMLVVQRGAGAAHS